MKPEIVIAIGSLSVAALSLIVAIVSAISSSRTAKAQAAIQARMLALEDVRHRAETRAMKRANVSGQIRKFGGTDFRLVVENAGPAPAKDVRITLDGKPAAQHSVWLGNVSDGPIKVLGAGAPVEYLLAVAQQSPDQILFDVSWENPDGQRDSWTTELKLF
jgi:hypothetical protein